MSVRKYVCKYVGVYVCLSIYLASYLFIYLPVDLSNVYLFICLSIIIYLSPSKQSDSLHPHLHRYNRTSLYLYIRKSFRHFNNLSVLPTVLTSLCLKKNTRRHVPEYRITEIQKTDILTCMFQNHNNYK